MQASVERRILLGLAFDHRRELLFLRSHIAQLLVALQCAPPHRLDLRAPNAQDESTIAKMEGVKIFVEILYGTRFLQS